jgi:uncharacterized membrane protein YraQ (UPF0718 family)
MDFILKLLATSLQQVWLSFQHNWYYLLASVIVATLLKLYMNAEKVSAFLARNKGAGVVASTAAAVATPLCSCGTTAVILGMMASTIPWDPIVAFMVSSPLSSPEGLLYSAGLFGWPFALTFYMASIVLGLGSGWAAAVLEGRGWLKNQSRFQAAISPVCDCENQKGVAAAPRLAYAFNPPQACCADGPVLVVEASSCGCSTSPVVQASLADNLVQNPGAGQEKSYGQKSIVTPGRILKELLSGSRYLLLMFFGFAFIGYFLNGLIPQSWISTLFGGGNIYNVPLAATLGLPFYLNSEGSLPLIRAMLDNGMSQGAAMAFMISGAGTSIGAITGALTIARWRVVALVVGSLWIGAILTGFVFNWMLGLGVF